MNEGEQHTYVHNMYMEYVHSHAYMCACTCTVYSVRYVHCLQMSFPSFIVDYLRSSYSAGSGI